MYSSIYSPPTLDELLKTPRGRFFNALVKMVAEAYTSTVSFGGLCFRGAAQYHPSDNTIRVEEAVLNRAQLETLHFIAGHELGHAWARKRWNEKDVLDYLFLASIACLFLGFYLQSITLLAPLKIWGLLVFRDVSISKLREEIRADWFATCLTQKSSGVSDAMNDVANCTQVPISKQGVQRIAAQRKYAQSALLKKTGWIWIGLLPSRLPVPTEKDFQK